MRINGTKERYKELCEVEPSIPIFSQLWWLDAVCSEANWDVVLVEKKGRVVASMPYYMPAPDVIGMPQVTQTMGPWLRPREGCYSKQLSVQKELMIALIEQLPGAKRFIQKFHYSITNWLPFYWKGFQQTTRYTYIIDDLSDLKFVYDSFSKAKKKNIKKAEKIVTIRWDLPKELFYSNHQHTLGKSGSSVLYQEALFYRIHDACYRRNQGRTIYAEDQDGNVHAALFVIWDEMSAYDLISTIDPDFRNSGATSLLVWEMIKYVKERRGLNRFDFEGSMIEGVENSFRLFGAKQVPYFQVFYDRRTRRQKVYDRLKNSVTYRINNVRGLLCK